MPLVTTTPYKDPCEGQTFSEDFETGDFSKWTYVSPTTPTITASPAMGSSALDIINGISDGGGPAHFGGLSGANKVFNGGTCVSGLTCNIHIIAIGSDDVPYLDLLDSSNLVILDFTPVAATATDASRRFYINGTPYVALSTGQWYTLSITNINFTAKTLDFDLSTVSGSPTSLASGSSIGFSNASADGCDQISIINQIAGSTGNIIYDNIVIA